MATIEQAFDGFHTQAAQLFKMKTISPSWTDNPERERKVSDSTRREILNEKESTSKRKLFSSGRKEEEAKR